MVALSSLGGAGWQFFDNNGVPLTGGKLYTYAAGTTNPAVTYTDSTGGTAHANPIILDSAGRIAQEIWLQNNTSYKFTLTSATDVVIWTKDNVPGILANIYATDVIYNSPFSGYPTNTVQDELVSAQASELAAINFFDFLLPVYTPAEIEQIVDGTFTGDLAVEWQAFRDALAAAAGVGKRPYGFIPSCTIRTSVAPNFAIDFLRLATQGTVVVNKIGGGAAMVFDGRSIGKNGYGIRNLNIDPIEANSLTGDVGYQIYWCHQSQFNTPSSRAATFAGIDFRSCVTTTLYSPRVNTSAEDWVVQPLHGIYVGAITGTTIDGPKNSPCSWSNLINPVCEYTKDSGIFLDSTFGMLLMNGTCEGIGVLGGVGQGHGLWTSTSTEKLKVIGGSYEGNTGDDIRHNGKYSQFYSVNAQQTIRFIQAARYNSVFGGTVEEFIMDNTTKCNLVTGMLINVITDQSVNPNANRFHDNFGGGYNLRWNDEWVQTNPTVTSQTGTITSATAVMNYLIRDEEVTFTVEVTIVDNGTGAGDIRVALPKTSKHRCAFAAVNAFLAQGAMSDCSPGGTVLRIRNVDGSYPGANGYTFAVSGTYRWE